MSQRFFPALTKYFSAGRAVRRFVPPVAYYCIPSLGWRRAQHKPQNTVLAPSAAGPDLKNTLAVISKICDYLRTMMHAFDTLKASKVLLDAGFEQAQAEALAVTVREAVTDHVATKDDLKVEIGALRSELKEDISALRSELKEDIGALRGEMKEMEAKNAEQFRDLYKHLWIMGLGIVGITVTLTVGLTVGLISVLIMVP